MEMKYKTNQTTVSLINYHFIFCSRYKRKVFNIANLEFKFKELIKQICEELEIEIIVMECNKDHTHLFLNCPPTLSPSDIMQKMKGVTSRELRKEFEVLNKMPSLWTRNYFISTEENIPSETINKYIEKQKSRY